MRSTTPQIKWLKQEVLTFQVLTRMQCDWNYPRMLVTMQNDMASSENGLAVSHQVKHITVK